MRRWILAAAIAAGMTLAQGAHEGASAQSPAEFYKGKTINLVTGFSAGGNYDLYARLLAEFLGKHIPGNPQVIVQNRPGAGSLNAAAYVIVVQPNDGLNIGFTANALPLDQLLEGANAKVDMKKVRWLGNLVELTSAVTVWHTAPVKTLEDLKKTEVVFGSTGPSGETYVVPIVLNDLIGTKIKMVTGYPGINEVMLGVERGEIHGRSGSWSNVQQRPDWITGKKIIPLLQIGVRKHPDLGKVPLLTDIVKGERNKKIAELISAVVAISRAPYLPPNTPEDRVKALRDAFDATMKDPAFIKAAHERNMELSPSTGVEVEQQMKRVLNVSPDVAEHLKKLLTVPK
jgi:tripartite-type tricarboxylate transporter receptor subunit TctC